MKHIYRMLPVLYALVMISLVRTANSQSSDSLLNVYKEFLETHQNMTSDQLISMYPPGTYKRSIDSHWEEASYKDSIETKYQLTPYEKNLLKKHGFLVTERLKENSFVEQFLSVWANDLPVFISVDAVLHAFHFYYDKILMKTEEGFIIHHLIELLDKMRSGLPTMDQKYSSLPEMDLMLRDVDVYLTVPLKLLGESVNPYYPENTQTVDELLDLINEQSYVTYPLFSGNCKAIDFSQFKPRGHYTETDLLKRYFKAMMWLGRTEIYLLPPSAEPPPGCQNQTPEDILRQTIDAALLLELISSTNSRNYYDEMEELLLFFVGEQDNVTLSNFEYLCESLEIVEAAQLLDPFVLKKFQKFLSSQPWSAQKILSQVLYHDWSSPDQVEPASAFMLFGQRFVIDSYITSNVVFDRIRYNGMFPCRLFPSTLDILFAMGNNASAKLLIPELNNYHYSTNLAALRCIVNLYDERFWESSMYNMWLDILRAINPPFDRTNLPEFMHTGAWWQQKMNTQLFSWTELRHDHLLYAKPSYTAGNACSFPHGYVEPLPGVFFKLSLLGERAYQKFSIFEFYDNDLKTSILDYFLFLTDITQKLGQIAQKEVNGYSPGVEDIEFIQDIICAYFYGVMDGWYLKLMYGPDYIFYGAPDMSDFHDFLSADFHTTPTDCGGNMMGWVSHAGTGGVDMAILAVPQLGDEYMAYAGPVGSYHEYTTTNFLRLNDEEWEGTYLQLSTRPDWVNLYLANSEGEFRGAGGSIITGISDETQNGIPASHLIARNYPNPFNPVTNICFSIPPNLTGYNTVLTVYDIRGSAVKELLCRELPTGNYIVKWDATNEAGSKVSSGVYFYKLQAGTENFIGKMMLLK